MNRLFRMFGAKVALVVIALVFFAGMPEFGAMEAEAKPRRGRSAQKRKVKRGKSARGRSRNRGKSARGSRGRGRNRGRVVRGGRQGRRGHVRGGRHGRRGRYGRGGRRVIVKKYRGRDGRMHKRRIVVRDRRHRGGRRQRRERYSAPTNSSNPTTVSSTPKTVPIRAPRGVVIPQERAREIQAALKNAGYYQGEVTGNYDDATREAMRSFQRANGIKDTGMPTAPALLKLGLTNHKSAAGDTSAPSVTPPPPTQPDGTPNR